MGMEQGYGAPVVRIFSEDGKEVFERVTNFSYMHTEKVEDASRFTIETPDESIVDNPYLQEGKAVKVVFGYMGGTSFRAHKLYIWDISPSFSESGVRLEIIGYCKAAYMKLNSSKDVHNDTSLDELLENMAESYGIGTKKENLDGQTQEDSLYNSIEVGEKRQNIFDLDNNQVLHARDNTAMVKKYVFKKLGTVPQANRSDAKLLEQLTDQEPVDGLVLEGRDDDLIIKRRNLFQKPFKSYKWKAEPGYLLEFSPALKNSNKQKEATSNTVAGWDEELGEYFQGNVSHSQSGAGLLGDVVQLTTEEKTIKDLENGIQNPLDQSKTVDGLATMEYDGVDENGKPQYKLKAAVKLDSTQKFFAHITKAGTRPSTLDLDTYQMSSAIDRAGRITTRGFIPVDPKEYLPVLADNAKDAAGQGVNRQSKKEMELQEGNATIIGDPEMRSGKIISILGVGKKYSGNYYVISCEHEITPVNGYRCRLVIAKNAKNRLGLDEADYNTVDGDDIGANKNKVIGLPNDGTSDLFEVPLKSDT